jgi:hypothetical protein
MCATAAHLMEEVLPEVALRQWVLTFPFAWRKKLAMAAFGADANVRAECARVGMRVLLERGVAKRVR